MLAHYFAINFVILHGLKIGISENNDLLKILASLREIGDQSSPFYLSH
jgi:hypothetical protein